MSEATLDIKPWGNNLGVRIPAAVARLARLCAHQTVRLTVEKGRAIITPQHDQPLTLAERLALFDPALHGGEAMAVTPVGCGLWWPPLPTTPPILSRWPWAVPRAAEPARRAYVLCHQPKSFDWRARHAKPHPQKRLADAPFLQACELLNQIVALA